MSKTIIIRKIGKKYKIPKLLKLRRNHIFKFEYNGKLYDKEIKGDREVQQISLLTQALNIKNRKERLTFIYDKSCDLLDQEFYGCNLCKFKNNQCFVDRIHGNSLDGCCRLKNNTEKCKYLVNHKCTNRNLSCKFHVCSNLKKKGYIYKLNDIYMIKYLYSYRQKLFCKFNYFISRKTFLKDIYLNSIIFWAFRKRPIVLEKDANNK